MAAMARCHDEQAVKPTTGVIGKTADGSFQTGRFKEYPELFGKALAFGIGEQILANVRSGTTGAIEPCEDELFFWVEEAAVAASVINDAAGFLPDYQGAQTWALRCFTFS